MRKIPAQRRLLWRLFAPAYSTQNGKVENWIESLRLPPRRANETLMSSF